MEQAIGKAKNGKRKAKEKAITDKAPQMRPIKDGMENLLELHHKASDSASDLRNAIKAVAESANVAPSVVRALVTAKASEKWDEKKRIVEQLAFVFDL